MAYEVPDVRARIGRDVEQLALQRARPRVPGDVADGVPATLARGQAGVGELPDERRRVGQRHVVHLDVLASGHMTLAQRDVLVDDPGEGVELIGGDATHGELHPHHLHVGLALTVDALAQPELGEIIGLELALEKARGLGVEVVELSLEDRDHVTGHVLQHLRVLARAGAGRGVGLDRGGLHHGSFRWQRLSDEPQTTKTRSE